MPRRILEGNVVSAKNDKTITVLVERRFMHPVYKKYIKSSGKYTAHDEANSCKEGDRVSIIECRPISKSKRWTLLTDDAESSPAEKKKPAAKKASPKKGEVKEGAKAKKADAPAKEKKAAEKKKPAAKKATKTKKDA